jgi:mannose-6-phosphate isomerase-like protein (cupin superfamily)
MDEAFVVAPGSGRKLDLGTFEAVVLATAEQTAGAYTLLQTRSEPPGFGPPLHRHRDAAEAFYVLEGEYLMHLPDGRRSCPPGSFVYVPRGVPHTFTVTSQVPGAKLNLFTPAAMLGFFEQLALAGADGPVTPDVLDRIAAEQDMEVLGPVPESYL